MLKTIFSIFMTIAICILVVTSTYANIHEEISSLNRSICPSCESSNSQSYCGGTYIGSGDRYETCTRSDGCRVVSMLYTTYNQCSYCGYGSYSGSHVHVIHTVCELDEEGCPCDSAVAK